jgi:GxxExxY protein
VKHDHITSKIIGGAIKVHSALGSGLLESAYKACLAHVLTSEGVSLRCEWPLEVHFNGVRLDIAYKVDMLVEDLVIVELKSVEQLIPVHEAQLLSYLKLSKRPVGLLINFNVMHLRDGICRKVL